jgi:hypothetical protein
MNSKLVLLGLGLALFCCGSSATRADEPATGSGQSVKETLEVKRADHKKRKYESLHFLRDNRSFLRSQFDQLRLEIGYDRDGQAQVIDQRLLLLRKMEGDIAAARDTIQNERGNLAQRQLLAKVDELSGVEAQLDLFEQLLADQQGRLLDLEKNFLGRQETALVVVLRGLPKSGAPDSLLLREENTTLHVALSPEQQKALQEGGVAQIYHEFVEPRAHRMELLLWGEGWDQVPATTLDFQTPRDQLTFLELDLSQLDANDPSAQLNPQVWQR